MSTGTMGAMHRGSRSLLGVSELSQPIWDVGDDPHPPATTPSHPRRSHGRKSALAADSGSSHLPIIKIMTKHCGKRPLRGDSVIAGPYWWTVTTRTCPPLTPSHPHPSDTDEAGRQALIDQRLRYPHRSMKEAAFFVTL